MTDAIGDDGLTDPERAQYADAYQQGAGRRTLCPCEAAAINDYFAMKDGNA
jgi:hypothetical protein